MRMEASTCLGWIGTIMHFSISQLAKMYVLEEQAPGWVSIEKELSDPIPLQAFIYQTGGDIPFKNPLLLFSRETWQMSHHLTLLDPGVRSQEKLRLA